MRFQFRWLSGALQWEGWRPPEDEPGRGYPVECRDPKMGRLVQRLNLLVEPRSFARLDPDGAGVLPALAVDTVEGRPLVCLSAHGMTVALAGRAWGLAAR